VAWMISVATAPSASTMGSCSPPLVRSGGCGGDGDVEQPSVEEPSGEEPFHVGFR
jgi:hypothetical protein